jgi:surface carbohydrate biosynthesis protein
MVWPMRIALIVDNPYRDLPGLALVALRLCERGAECCLVPMNLAQAELGALTPDFALLNYLRTNNEDMARQLVTEAGIPTGVLDTEGGVFVDWDDYATGKMTANAEVRDLMACYCSWGKRIAAHAPAAGWYRTDQIAVTGAPRFDFYAKPWRQSARTLAPEAARFADGPLILVNSSFSLANPRYSPPEQEIDNWVKLGYDRADIAAKQATQRRTLDAMAALTNRIAARFPAAQVVYRPHPFERLETYHDRLDARDNLHLILEGTVDGWLLRADALVQRSCSTAIEAGMAGLPALSPAWIPTALPIDTVERISVPCADEADLMDRLDAAVRGERVIPPGVAEQLDAVIADWFYAVDGKAHERVADAILAHAGDAGSRVPTSTARRIHRGQFRAPAPLRKRIAGMVRAALNLPATWTGSARGNVGGVRWDSSGKHYDPANVRALVEAINEARTAAADHDPVPVDVLAAQAAGTYRFDYPAGRTVVVRPKGSRGS